MSIIKKIVRKYFTRNVIQNIRTPVFKGNLVQDNIALIVGGGGIGEAIATALLDNGASIIVSGRNQDKLERICQKLAEHKRDNSIDTVLLDVNDISSIEEAIQNAWNIHGRIDILVYSAGVHGNDPFGAVSESTWNDVFNINLKGMYFVDQAVANLMIKNNAHGHILNVGSASCAKPGWTPYEISKSAVRSLTLGFADKLIQHGIVVNSIAPGPVATSMLGLNGENLSWPGNPTGRVATPEEIANIAVMMVSSTGDLIVGDTFFVSGGSGTICIDR